MLLYYIMGEMGVAFRLINYSNLFYSLPSERLKKTHCI